MKKKFVLGLILSLLIITGCEKENTVAKGSNVKKDKNTHICIKKDVKQKGGEDYDEYSEDITYTAKLDKDKKLKHYSSLFEYTYKTKKDCDYWCDIKTKWSKDINDKNYKGGHRETKCSCDKNKLTEEYVYDDIENLDSILRSDIRELNSDNTFDLDAWLKRYKKFNYTCE